ncbi:FAD-binding monooxygenase [Talaromyces proteolyticus]|uniref:FAD-binding monooxygenase n=1 Tax=Talaromyces proteolyticus TaxID=1131652 RepID=A0AAD4KS18_9EURO|nr:FAD-binding monooxygenase [Talaromyces proteolyticus]KAH8697940.1 FAD-binding monooxygenase [Talaromyces proteolyticus]
MSSNENPNNLPTEVPVLVIGGGGSGLTLSILLSDYGITSLLVERRSGTSHMPKAGAHNQRSLEIFRRHCIAEEIQHAGVPAQNRLRAAWMTSLGGGDPIAARELYSIDLNGEGSFREIYERDSPELSAGLGQHLLEPLLRKHAESRSQAILKFGHQLMTLEQHHAGVIASIKDMRGEIHRVRARYVIAADGGRTVGPMLGAQMIGRSGLAEMLSIFFRADLSSYVSDDVMAYWFVGPKHGSWAGGSLVKAGPHPWNRHSPTWTIHFMLPEGDSDIGQITVDNALPRLQDLLHLPNLKADILGVSPWKIDAVQVDRYRIGDVFFIGDAAHRQPPTSGLGLQSAIQDADNLSWKLASVLHGQASEDLLDTYETERRPVCKQNVEYALFAFENQFAFEAGLGLNRAKTVEERSEVFEAYFEETPLGATRRARAAEVFNTVRLELNPHDRELGFYYEAGALVPDGTSLPERDPMGVSYRPTTRPGSRLPHAWLNNRGARLSTHDLGRTGEFVLLCGYGAAALEWSEAATQLAKNTKIPIVGIRIAPDGDYGDPTCIWSRLREVSNDGAILLRPDKYVAARYHSSVKDPYSCLRQAFERILGKVVDASVTIRPL